VSTATGHFVTSLSAGATVDLTLPNGIIIRCTSSSLAGSVASDGEIAAGGVTSAAIAGCFVVQNSAPMTVMVNSLGSWTAQITANASTPPDGALTLSNVDVTMTIAGGAPTGCTLGVTGGVSGEWANGSPASLAFTAAMGLTVNSATGAWCPPGSTGGMTYDAQYDVDDGAGGDVIVTYVP
jgi:hypothetical protein